MNKQVVFSEEKFKSLPNSDNHQILATKKVSYLMQSSEEYNREFRDMFKQFFSCQWGEDIENDEEDKAVNNNALKTGGRILGVYYINDDKFFIITSPHWMQTELMFAEEY